MLKRQLRVLSGCLVFCGVLSSCSSDKILPDGKRISVLEQVSAVKPDVIVGTKTVQVPVATTNVSWLQSDMNERHAAQNIKVGADFQKQWSAGFGTGSSKREFLISKPLIKNKTVYALDADGVLSAFDLFDGEKLWTLELESGNGRVRATSLKGSGIAIAGDNIYVTTGFGVVAAINLKSRKKIWENNLKSPLRIAPVLAAGKVFVQSVDNKFFALDAGNGEILWQYDIAMENTTMVGGAQAAYDSKLDMVIIGFSNGELQAFNAALGSPLWADILVTNRRAYSSTFLHTLKASPVIDDDYVYALGSSGIFTAIELRSGERVWEKEIGGTVTPLLVGGTLYVVTEDNYLVALNKENGNILWSSKISVEDMAKDSVVYAPLMLNGQLIVALSDGHVLSYNPHDGSVAKTVDLGEGLSSAPIAADGYVLFTTLKAKLLAFK